MRDGTLAPMGGPGGIVEIDETSSASRRGKAETKRGAADKKNVLTLVERGGGARSFHIISDFGHACPDFSAQCELKGS